MTVTIRLALAETEDSHTVCTRVAEDVGAVLEDLGYAKDIEVAAGAEAETTGAYIGSEFAPVNAFFSDLFDDDAAPLVLSLIGRRPALVASAEAGLAASDASANGALRTLLALFGVSLHRLPDQWTTPPAAVTAALASHDKQPLQVRFGDEALLAQLLPDGDGQLRESLFAEISLPLPSFLSVTAEQSAGTVGVRVRDVRYPDLPMRGSGDAERLARYVGWVAGANAVALLTPASVNALLASAAMALPTSTRLARARWQPDEIVDLVRLGLTGAAIKPRDNIALQIERIALMPRPEDPGADDFAQAFPVMAAALDLL